MLSSGSLGSSLGLNNIKLESPAYYCSSYTPPCSDNFTTLNLPRTSSPSSVAVSLADNSVIRVKRMRRMSSETEEELREKTSSVSELQYYTGSPLQAGGWTHTDIEQATSIGKTGLTLTPSLTLSHSQVSPPPPTTPDPLRATRPPGLQ